MAEPGTSTAGSPASIADANATHLKLPTFVALDAPTWFFRAEVSFRIHRTPTTRQADHVIAALPEDIFIKVSKYLRENPDISYSEIKNHLLSRFAESAASRAAKIRALSLQPLGEDDPVDAWNELENLAAMDPPVDMLKELFLARLPSHIRSALPKAAETDTQTLAKQAKDLMEAHAAASPPSAAYQADQETATPDDNPDPDDVSYAKANQTYLPRYKASTIKNQWYTNPRQQQTPYQPQPYKFTCWYHMQFGPRARNCINGCTFSKNLPSGHK